MKISERHLASKWCSEWPLCAWLAKNEDVVIAGDDDDDDDDDGEQEKEKEEKKEAGKERTRRYIVWM